jgi:hypothetical protein
VGERERQREREREREGSLKHLKIERARSRYELHVGRATTLCIFPVRHYFFFFLPVFFWWWATWWIEGDVRSCLLCVVEGFVCVLQEK